MPYSSLPPELRDLLQTPNAGGLTALLLSPHLAEGTVFFDPPEGQLSVRGDFVPGSIKVNVSVIERCRLLLTEAGIVLNVVMFPGRSDSSKEERFHFQLVDWNPKKKASKLHPQCPPMEDIVVDSIAGASTGQG